MWSFLLALGLITVTLLTTSGLITTVLRDDNALRVAGRRARIAAKVRRESNDLDRELADLLA